MKKKVIFVMSAVILALVFPLFACSTRDNNSLNNSIINDNEQTNISDESDDINDNEQTNISDESDDSDIVSSNDIITDWETKGIFVTNAPKYEFDFSAKDTNFTYEIGSEENEELFARILSGEENYIKYLWWFAVNPDYIYRINEECYKVTAEIIREGAFTQQLRDKYFGLFIANATIPYFAALGVTTESYQIYFNDDWSIQYIRKSVQNLQSNAFERWHYNLIGYTLDGYDVEKSGGEWEQYSEFIDPYYESQRLIGYNVTFTSLLLNVGMGNGKTAACSVHATYNDEIVTKNIWNGQKQEHEAVTFLSQCTVTADFNNVYSGGFVMFDQILIFAKQNGLWDLIRVWEQYREEVLTPSLNQYETSEQKVYRLAEQL